MVSSETVTSFEKCHCTVDGLFTLEFNDIRLKIENDAKCSPAVIQVDFDRYSCNNISTDYEAMFQQTLDSSVIKSSVIMAANSWTIFPESVWIIVKPEGWYKFRIFLISLN